MKFCVDCKTFDKEIMGCFAPQLCLGRDMVTGEYLTAEALEVRNDPTKCGTDAKWFTEFSANDLAEMFYWGSYGR